VKGLEINPSTGKKRALKRPPLPEIPPKHHNNNNKIPKTPTFSTISTTPLLMDF
jgi:hypothetical protein